MTLTAEDGPQETAAAAYQHASDVLSALADKARKQSVGQQRAWVQVEYIDHLAFTFGVRAEEAARIAARAEEAR